MKKISKNIRFLSFSVLCIGILILVVNLFADKWEEKLFNYINENASSEFKETFCIVPRISIDEELNIGYIPDGYMLKSKIDNEKIILLSFEKEVENEEENEAKTFQLTMNHRLNEAGIGEEEDKEKLKINNKDAVYFTLIDNNCLLWHDDEYTYTLVGNINKDELVQIANSVNL